MRRACCNFTSKKGHRLTDKCSSGSLVRRRARRSCGSRARLLDVWIVAGAGAHHQLVVAFGMRLHAYHAEASLTGRLGGVITNCVLLANILRHLSRNLVHLAKVLWEEGDAPRLVGEHFQRSTGTAGLPSTPTVVVEQPNRIHHRTLEVLDATYGFLKRGAGSIVFAVGDDQ